MKSVKFLETLQREKNLNDSEVAKLLQKSKSSISQYKSGTRVMDEEMCLALAMELDIDPITIIAAAGMDRAEKSGQKSLWEVFIMRTQTVKTASVSALLCFVFFTNLLNSQEAKAAPALSYKTIDNAESLYYVKLMKKILRNLRSKTRSFLAIFGAAKRTMFFQNTSTTATT